MELKLSVTDPALAEAGPCLGFVPYPTLPRSQTLCDE